MAEIGVLEGYKHKRRRTWCRVHEIRKPIELPTLCSGEGNC